MKANMASQDAGSQRVMVDSSVSNIVQNPFLKEFSSQIYHSQKDKLYSNHNTA